ncbi:MAG: aldehyde ferredoxin oxidoreductase family protein [Planctomycetaceae bacterium]|nr:aldehyde ferredoxin oxidoreductase family protein [Planctomycetaceae bacterium]
MTNTAPGYFGRYLRIDVSTGTSEATPIPESVLRQYVGGVGLGTWILQQETEGPIDPLSAEAPLEFCFSPLVGSPLTTSAKFAVVAKSPLTNRLNDSLASSHFAITGKKTGYDAFVIVGKCDSPQILMITEEGISLEDAAELWGQTIPDSEETLKENYGSEFRYAVIGPAGENLVRYATISHDGRHAGRGGLGAVLGSKKLKAIGVRGNRRLEFARPEELVALSKSLSKKSFGPATEKYRELGTAGNLLVFNRLGTLPTRNFQAGEFEHAVDLAPETLTLSREKARKSCAACTIGCEHLYPVKDREKPVRLEYENLFALGPLCGVGEVDQVLRASQLCDELGIDTISAGGTIAFAMECAERGLLDWPGYEFGRGETLLTALEKIAARREEGNDLAEGSRLLSQQIGQGSEAFAPHVKGLELPGYEPRALQSMALGFAVGTRGADHNRSGAYQNDFSDRADRMQVTEQDVAAAIETEDEAALIDSLILCKFLRGVFEDKFAEMAEMLALVTGWDVDGRKLKSTAQRIIELKKRYNIAQGWTPAEDTLPDRFLSSALEQGASAGASLPRERLERLVRAYNLERGWDADGYPAEAHDQNSV